MRHIPAIYNGQQERLDGTSFALWTIYAAIPGHPCFSTVSEQTLNRAGYVVYPITPNMKEAS